MTQSSTINAQNLVYVLESEPLAVRSAEGGGTESLDGSVALTIARMRAEIQRLGELTRYAAHHVHCSFPESQHCSCGVNAVLQSVGHPTTWRVANESGQITRG